MKRLALRQPSRSASTRSCAVKLSAAPAFRVEYAVREGRGDGVPPVVALHCSGSNHKQWTPLCDALKYHCVVAPNLFGSRGTTAWPPRGRPQTLDDSARLRAPNLRFARQAQLTCRDCRDAGLGRSVFGGTGALIIRVERPLVNGRQTQGNLPPDARGARLPQN